MISGRSPEKRGNGLKVVRRVAESGPVGLKYYSGLGVVLIRRDSGKMEIETTAENVRGTFAVLTF